ncbi:MAG: NifU N-terminal domain-containing protein [Desulfobacteraceae bacterium]|jgi:hypothetical protein
MNEPEIVIYHHPNPQMKSFLTHEEVSAPRVEHFKKPLTKESEEALKALGLIGAQTVREIMAIPGVISVQIKPKEICVKKETASSWEDIQESVIEILRMALRRKRIKVVKR